MKQQRLKITIPEPCDERWDRMQVLPNGRHCEQCSRNLFDFAGMPDAEVLKLVERTNGKICGRFSISQLDRILSPNPGNRTSKTTVPALMLTVLAAPLTLPQALKAQTTPSARIEQVPVVSQANPGKAGNAQPKELVVRAKLVDRESGTPIEGRTVYVAGTELQATTGPNGMFTMGITDDLLVNDSLVFHIRYDYRYRLVEFKIATKDLAKNIRIPIGAAEEEMLLGVPLIVRPVDED